MSIRKQREAQIIEGLEQVEGRRAAAEVGRDGE